MPNEHDQHAPAVLAQITIFRMLLDEIAALHADTTTDRQAQIRRMQAAVYRNIRDWQAAETAENSSLLREEALLFARVILGDRDLPPAN